MKYLKYILLLIVMGCNTVQYQEVKKLECKDFSPDNCIPRYQGCWGECMSTIKDKVQCWNKCFNYMGGSK